MALIPGEPSPGTPAVPREAPDDSNRAPEVAAVDPPADASGPEGVTLEPRKQEQAEPAPSPDPRLLLARPDGNSDISQEAMNSLSYGF